MLDGVNEANASRFEARMDARFDASRDEWKRVLAERFEGHTRWMMVGWSIIFAALIANPFRR